MKNSKHRNSNATAAGAEGGVEGDLYILSDGELAGVAGGDSGAAVVILTPTYSSYHGSFSEFPPLGRY